MAACTASRPTLQYCALSLFSAEAENATLRIENGALRDKATAMSAEKEDMKQDTKMVELQTKLATAQSRIDTLESELTRLKASQPSGSSSGNQPSMRPSLTVALPIPWGLRLIVEALRPMPPIWSFWMLEWVNLVV